MRNVYFWLFLRQAVYFIRRLDAARLIVASVFLLILTLLAIASFFFGRLFADYVSSFGVYSRPTLYFVLLSVLSGVSVLSLISFTIVFLKTLFDNKLSLLFLRSKPPSIALSVFFATILVGSWPYILISLPFFLGMIVQAHSAFTQIVNVVLLHLILSVTIATIGGVVAFLLHLLLGKRLAKALPVLFLFMLFGCYLLFTKVIYPKNLKTFFSQGEIGKIEMRLKNYPLAAPFLPTTLFVDSLSGDARAIFVLSGQMGVGVIIFLTLAFMYYRSLWQKSYEGYLIADIYALDQSCTKKTLLPYRFHQKNALLVFFEKEALFIWRSMGSRLYASFIVFLCAVFAFFLSAAGTLDRDYEQLIPFVNYAIFFAASYLILLLSIRFVFPSFTFESPFVWSYITARSSRQKLSVAKWIFYQCAVMVFSLVLGAVILRFFKLTNIDPLRIFFYLFVYAATTTTLALFLGQIFQKDLPKSDADAIATTIPGILFTVLSLAVGVGVLLLVFSYTTTFLSFSVFAIVICTIVISFRKGVMRYQRSDI